MKWFCLICIVLIARAAFSQEVRPEASSISDGTGQWEPLDQIPVDQAGSGRRGYGLSAEGSEVAAPGDGQVSFHTVAANNFYREQTGDFLISQRYETHTLAIGYRRGFKLGAFPRFEVGGQLQLHERDTGFLNGFISGFEGFWAGLTGSASAENQLRTNDQMLPPLGAFAERKGLATYRSTGDASGFGDFSVVAKALLRDGGPSSNGARVAARVVMNVSGSSDFTDGNFAGVGLSVTRKISGRTAFHGDARATLVLDRSSRWGLPLKRTSFGFSLGPELKLTRNSSISVQYDGQTTPYELTGTRAFDEGYGDITVGVGHRFNGRGRRVVVTQLYARENMNLPFRVRWNLDPDLSVGLKITIHSASR